MKKTHPLIKIAQNQSGLFTSNQATQSGIDSRNHSYHFRKGNWIKLQRGVYRLSSISTNSKKDFFLFQLWARNRKGNPVGVFSYKTALYLMGLESKQPDKFYITVPTNFRRSINDERLVVYYEDLINSDKIIKNNLCLTSMKKTFQDLMIEEHPADWIKQKLKMAIEQHLISLQDIRTIKLSEKFQKIFNAILFELN